MLIIGGGLIGLACAVAVTERGLAVRVVSDVRPGEASRAAAGLLAPSIERGDGPIHAFAVAARDRYPSFLEWLRERSPVSVSLDRAGIIQLALNQAGIRGLQRTMPPDAQWLDATELAELEPSLAHGLGGVLHPVDGAVDNVQLHEALLAAAERDPRIAFVRDTIVEIRCRSNSVAVTGASGSVYDAGHVVLCAGAWSNTIAGLPRRLPVEPVRGQMVSYAAAPFTRPVYGPTGYAVPRRDGRTLIGSTMEHTGYVSATTPEGIARLQKTAAEIFPGFATLTPLDTWAGLRPMSADLQPIIGPDPDEPRLVYATGHSRNGVLMTPITADCVAALLTGERLPYDLSAFAANRFAATSS